MQAFSAQYYWMIRNLLFTIFFLPLTSLAQSTLPQAEQYFNLVRPLLSGQNAFETVAFVEQFWRLPGNQGFDTSIYKVQALLEAAGYRLDSQAQLQYRLERRPLGKLAWEPLNASLTIEGEEVPLLSFANNRNMLAINSWSTPINGITAEVVYLPSCIEEELDKADLKGKIVLVNCHPNAVFDKAVREKGAIGVLGYAIPGYNRPNDHPNSISFSGIRFNSDYKSWAILLSTAARDALIDRLNYGPLKVNVNIQSRFRSSDELTIVAKIKGSEKPEEQFVYSAHVQEPGANDNASGVGCLAEMARVAAELVQSGKVNPKRSLVFLWGDEIRSTRRYIEEDPRRAAGIRWGMSLDMVGEDTEKTGGTFLIEKMPDPSAIWTRGEDRHTEWGAGEVNISDLKPHYFNDLVIHICRAQGKYAGWTVNTNPFEGGSDHQPFLDAGIPGLLFWHFTDVYYHTDGDRIDKVSARTLQNVGISALVTGLVLVNADQQTSLNLLNVIRQEAHRRLMAETKLSESAVQSGSGAEEQNQIVNTWRDWYQGVFTSLEDLPANGSSKRLRKALKKAERDL